MKTQSYVLTAALLAGLSTSASAAILASYDFTGGSAAQSSGLLTGANATTGTGPAIRSGGFIETSVSITPTTLALAITGNDYAAITITNNTGQVATLDTLTFDWWFNSPDASGTQSYSMFGLSDVNGFTDGQEFGVRTLGEGGTPGVSFNAHDSQAEALNVPFDISSLGSLADAASIEFRLYFVDTRSGVSSPDQLIDNIVVNGTAVPEPSSAVLLGALGSLALLRRRK